MNKKQLLVVLILSFCASLYSQEMVSNIYFPKDRVIDTDGMVLSSTQTVNGNHSFTNFELSISNADKYYVSFWLCPSKHSDGSYATYEVLLDKEKIGTISPNHDDWQSISLDNNISVPLEKGYHTLSVVGSIPDIPSVENVHLATMQKQAAFDNSAYSIFKKELEEQSEITPQKSLLTDLPIDTIANQKKAISFPLGPQANPPYDADYRIHETIKYTFYKKVFFTAGQTINVSTVIKKNFSHVVEIFSQELPQQYSWAVLATPWTPSSLIMKAPITDYYIIRVRSYLNATAGLCDLIINQDIYENVPVYSYGIRNDKTPGVKYISFTSHNSGGSPRMWIEEGGTPGVIKAYNNNYSGSSDFSWGNNCRVDRVYADSLNAVLLSTASSSTPISYCDIYANCKSSDILTTSTNYIRSAPGTPNYNCISWSGGIYTHFIWPPSVFTEIGNDLNSFDKFYGFERYPGCSKFTRSGATASNCSVVLWANIKTDGTREYTHASVRKGADDNAHGFAWESKCGSLSRIYHPENATLYNYGQVVEYYRRVDAASTVTLEEAIADGNAVVENVKFTEDEQDYVISQITKISEDAYNEFSRLFDNWESVWNNSPYSNPKQIADCTEYRDLLKYCSTSSLFLYAIYEKLSEGSICATCLLEDLTVQDKMDVLKKVLDEKAKKEYTDNGVKIVRTIQSNAMSYVKEIINGQRDNSSKSTRRVQVDGGISYSNSDTYDVKVRDSVMNIQFNLKETSKVSAIVMDLEGRVICELANNKAMAPSSYSFNCELPQGVFLVIYTLNGNVNVKKIAIK